MNRTFTLISKYVLVKYDEKELELETLNIPSFKDDKHEMEFNAAIYYLSVEKTLSDDSNSN